MSSILAFVSWYAIITLLGWLTFPLAYFLFPALADRGYSLSRVAGLLIWGYVFWIFTSLGLNSKQRRRDFICVAGFDWSERMGVIQYRKSNIKYILLAENEPAPRGHR